MLEEILAHTRDIQRQLAHQVELNKSTKETLKGSSSTRIFHTMSTLPPATFGNLVEMLAPSLERAEKEEDEKDES